MSDSGQAGEILMDVLAKLEDLLYEPYVDDRGVVWNSPSEEAEIFQSNLRAFNERCFRVMHDYEGKDGDGGGYSLQMMELHREYCMMVESAVEHFLAEHHSKDAMSFGDLLSNFLTGESAASWAREGAREVVTILREVSDFQLWAREMRTKLKAQAVKGEGAPAISHAWGGK
eukprot:g5285.t1